MRLRLLFKGNDTMSNDRSALSRVAAQVTASEQAAKEAAERARARDNERGTLADQGMDQVRVVLTELIERARHEAGPSGRVDPKGRIVHVGDGQLSYELAFSRLEADAFPRSHLVVVAGVYIGVEQRSQEYPGRSGNLWYGDLDRSGSYSWWEAAYMAITPSYNRLDTPFGVSDYRDLTIADRTAGPAMDVFEYAFRPVRIEGRQLETFYRRWLDFLAGAAMNSLRIPGYLPEN